MITGERVGEIAQFINSQTEISEAVMAQLRSAYPEIHFTYCMDDDVVAASPVTEGRGYNLYLIDSRGHCLVFTEDLEIATGIVLAEIENE